MSATTQYGEPRLARLEQASLWLQRIHQDAADERLMEEWLDWCQRDPLNQQAFDEMVAVWELSRPAATADTPPPTRARPHARRMALAASLAALALTAVAGLWYSTQSPAPATLRATYTSPVGANSQETLADGSRLELGGATRVAIAMSAGERRVELLAGELFVAVHRDASRPFRVDAGPLQVTATGTAFNVQRTSGRTTVTVAEGAVDALYEARGANAPNVQLQAGQQLVYTHATHRVVVRQANPRDVGAWRSGMLHFHDEPLAEVIATVNRYSTRPISIADPDTGALPFTGTARVDSIDGWLRALPHALPVFVEQQPDGRQLIGSRRGGASD